MDILYFSKNPPLAFLKPGAILIPLEVYLVNSPSRPNSRPACPLFPAERGSVSRRNLARPAGMIIETRTPSVRRISLRFTAPHPVSSIALHRQGGAVRLLPSSSPQPPFAVDLLLPSRHHQASIKAKTPAIVHNQGISRLTVKINKGIKWATGFSLWSAGAYSRFREPCHLQKRCRRSALPPQSKTVPLSSGSGYFPTRKRWRPHCTRLRPFFPRYIPVACSRRPWLFPR